MASRRMAVKSAEALFRASTFAAWLGINKPRGLTRLRGFGHFLGVRVKEINILTEKVFTTGGVGREARRRRFWGAAGPAA